MADYTSQFTGQEIDSRLAKVPQLESGLAGKQATLVSGTNIKTLNGESILGSGNITIQGGGLTAEDVEDISDVESTLASVALRKTAQTLSSAEIAQVWENLGLDAAWNIPVGSAIPVGGMLPNVFYSLGTINAETTMTMAAATDNAIFNEWMFQFSTGSTAPTIIWDAAITGWLNGETPTIDADKTYQISVVNGLGVIAEF